MKKTILTICTALILIAGCKKENKSEPTTTPDPTASNPTIEGVFTTFIIVGSPTKYSSTAQFWESNNTGTYIDPDSVSLNNTWLADKVAGNNIKYGEWMPPVTPPFDFFTNVNWTTTGSTKVPAIFHTNSTPLPYLDNTYINISSVSKAAGVTISHSNISATQTDYKIYGGTGTLYLTKSVSGNSTGTTFTASELAGIPTGNLGMIRIQANSHEIVSPQSAVNFTFTNSCQVQKTIPITN